MTHTKLCLGLIAAATLFLFATIETKAQSQPASAFVGNWVLDKGKASAAKGFPQKLKDYTMIVAENDNLLNVKSRVGGDVMIETTIARDASVNQRIYHNGTAAVFFTPNDATYDLSGKETKVELKQAGDFIGTARVKAKMDKKGLQINTIRRMKTGKGEIDVTTRETWKLSDDGKSLRLQRIVELPESRDEIGAKELTPTRELEFQRIRSIAARSKPLSVVNY